MTKKKVSRLFTLTLTIILCLVQIAVVAEARASDYIASYDAVITADGSGKVSVWFSVTGTGKMDQIGATKVIIYDGKTGKALETFLNTDYPGMLATNTNTYTSSITYSGTAGTSYYATAYVWAGKGGKGDSRAPQTTTIVAT